MVDRTRDAKIRLKVDPEEVRQEVEELESLIEEAEGALQEERTEKENLKRERDKDKEEQDKEKKERGGVGRPRFPALTTADIVGAVPLVGGAGKIAVKGIQRFGPIASGVLPAIAEEVGGSAVGLAVEKAVDAVTDRVNDLDARLKAIQPAFEKMISAMKASVLAGVVPNATDAASFLSTFHKIEAAQIRFDRGVRDATLKLVAEGAGGAVRQYILQAIKGGSAK